MNGMASVITVGFLLLFLVAAQGTAPQQATETFVTTTSTFSYLTVSTDKTAYLPGETVHISGEAITPSVTWDYTYTVSDGNGLEVQIQIFDPSNNLIHSGTSSRNAAEYRRYAHDYALQSGAGLGTYRIHARYSSLNIEGEGSFDVSTVTSTSTSTLATVTSTFTTMVAMTSDSDIVTLSSRSGQMTPGILVSMELTQITIHVPNVVGPSVFPGLYPISVSFSCSGQPSGADIKFDPNPLFIPGPGDYTTVMSATTQYATPAGVYDLKIAMYNVNNPSITHEEHYQLTVTPSVPGFDITAILIGLGLGMAALSVIHKRKRGRNNRTP